TACPVEALVEVPDRALRRGHEFRLAMVVQEPAPIGVVPDPAQVMTHQAAHRLARAAVAVELAEEALLVVAQALDVERRGQLLLAAEVMIDAADARFRAHADVRERRAGKSDRREAMQRGPQDIPFAGVRSRLPPARCDGPAGSTRVAPPLARGRLYLPLHWNGILEYNSSSAKPRRRVMDSRGRIVDAWMQHPSPGFLAHPMLGSLRRWGRGAFDADSGEVPISHTIRAMDEGGVRLGLCCAWW